MNVIINGKQIEIQDGLTVLQAVKVAGVFIPTLCHLEKINEISACRVCLAEVNGKLVPACSTAAAADMQIITDSERVRAARRRSLELICADHCMDCTDCPRGADCELRDLCREYEVDDQAFGIGRRKAITETSAPHLIRDNSKCILCRRCEATCRTVQGIGAIGVTGRGGETTVGFGLPLAETDCIHCGQCIAACPTGALSVRDATRQTWKAILSAEKKKTAAFVSPEVCRQLETIFGAATGEDCEGKTAAMLRRIGFSEVFLIGSGVSACPAWRNYLEKHHPELSDRLPRNGTPWERAAEEYRAGCGKDVHITVITPCTAAKGVAGEYDTALTGRELAAMWRRACVSSFTAVEIWKSLAPEPFDRVWPDEPDEIAAEGIANAEALLAAGTLKSLNVLACPGGCSCGGGMTSESVLKEKEYSDTMKKEEK